MKRALIGGFLSLIGSIWTLAVAYIAGNHLSDCWSTPPGRFLTTVLEMNLTVLFIFSVAMTLLGLIIMIIELFRKDP